ncbi:MAG TPA: HEPN domain-containing protein [Pyrinomonadaceae bacterium]|nr:HEPN domain-containing protein [Pyrinomonadaceae bacterium]
MDSTYRNPELRDCIESYVRAAIDLIAEGKGTKYPYDDWSAAPEFPFIFSKTELKELPAYRHCLESLQADEIIIHQLNNMVGINSRRSRTSDVEGLMVRLPHLGVYRNRIRFNEEHFETEYAAFESAFYEDSFVYEAIAPLQGPVFAESIKLESEVEICRLNQFDLSPLTKNDMDEDSIIFGNALWAIKTQYRIPKVIGDEVPIETDKTKEDESRRDQANDVLDRVLACLRLLGVPNAYPQVLLHRTKSWLFHDVREYSTRHRPSTQFSWELDADFTRTCTEFWAKLQSQIVQRHHLIIQAIKRFNYAHERHDWEDKIVDLLIAAEAIFLSQSGGSGELSYRLKLNAAMFLASDARSRKQVFDDMDRAYSLRSKIVHGADYTEIKKEIEKKEAVGLGEEYKFDQFIFRIQGYIQTAIHRMIDIASTTSKGDMLVKWNSLILGNPEDQSDAPEVNVGEHNR